MTDAIARRVQRAAELRSAFDRSFATPFHGDAPNLDILAIRVGEGPFAVRLAEVAGVFADHKVTRVPGSSAALLGIAGFRGALLPVYNLRALLGYSGTQSLRWLVIASAAPVALAFDAFEGRVRVPANAILPQQSHAQMRSLAPDFVRTDEVIRPVLHLSSVIDSLDAMET